MQVPQVPGGGLGTRLDSRASSQEDELDPEQGRIKTARVYQLSLHLSVTIADCDNFL